MLFNSWEYALLLLLSTCLYWLTTNLKFRRSILLAASVVFYCTWSVPFFFFFFAVMWVNWWAALKFESTERQAYINLAVIASLAILFIFKYIDFTISNINELLPLLGMGTTHIPLLHWELPLGISFYIFQIIAYTIDVNRRQIKADKSFWDVTLFIVYFPQLIAGPICRATELIPQLNKLQIFQIEKFTNGLFIMLGGLVLKSAFADGLAPYVNAIFANYQDQSAIDLFWGMYGFGIQIFCDFCGYSLMAVGSAKLFGYDVPFNFDLPYFSTNIQAFWRRWHITLSSWLRDYLYIPLGGSRGSEAMTYRNLFLTMLLGGIWHGANWTFVVWGSIHGFALCIHRFICETKAMSYLRHLSMFKFFGWLLTMTVVYISWIFFRAPSSSVAFQYIARMLSFHSGWQSTNLDRFYFELIILFIPIHLLVHHFSFKKPISESRTPIFALSFAVLILISIVYYVDGQDFIYFQF